MTDSNRARAIVAMVGDLPVLPQIAHRVIDLMADPDVQIGSLEALITRDPALSASVLRLTNSAFFNLRHSVHSISRAIALMGLRQLKSLVLATSAEALFVAKRTGFKQRILWEHALGVALTARLIAYQSRKCDVEDAFTAGLLHDIGKAVLDVNMGDRYLGVIEAVYNSNERFLDAERQQLGVDHQEVGSLVMANWKLAPALHEAVALHHTPAQATIAPALCATVSLANSMCVRAGIGPERRPDLDLASLDAAEMLRMEAPALEAVIAQVTARLAEEKAVFNL